MSRGKKYKKNFEQYDSVKEYALVDAVELLSNFEKSNFDESVDVSINLGVDPRHADQLVRGTVSLPNGTGKDVKAVVVTKDDEKSKECIEAGAIEAGSKDLLDKIEKGGFKHFMLKEIYEQPSSIKDSIRGRIRDGNIVLGGIELDDLIICVADLNQDDSVDVLDVVLLVNLILS